MAKIELLPLGRTLAVPDGTRLQEVLFAEGVEFPCGGRGRCKGCRVKVLDGRLPATVEDEKLLGTEAVAGGGRRACRGEAHGDLRLELAQWEATILGDETAFTFEPGEGLGAAVDLGTTTIVAQLLDLRTGNVLGVRTGLNAQARHGADVMSRIDFALAEGGLGVLTGLVREQIGGLLADLMAGVVGGEGLRRIVIVGNTVMHHLFCGLSVEPLSHHPFEPFEDGLKTFRASALGWGWGGEAEVLFLPGLGSFVGSDILAGILASGIHEGAGLAGLVDLGTNGEMVVGNRERLLCASTAAGPAFEGARISMGMRAATGAIAEVTIEGGALNCRVLGLGSPRGICGSGLVDAVACGLDLGWVGRNGRLRDGGTVTLAGPVTLTQTDVRELQLAKGAIAAGLRLLLEEWGAKPEDLETLHLAGAFGNYINRSSARRIGLLGYPPERVRPAGNTALLGAKLALFRLPADGGEYQELRARVRHVSLNECERFHEIYVEEMGFPAGGQGS
jgi:uncharacterized 2Fe-2S/4Fe-4S cluster protein (DUF4445 family)